MVNLAWWVVFLPLLAFLLISLVTRPHRKLSGWITILAVGASFVLSVAILLDMLARPGARESAWQWLSLGPVHVELGVLLDPLAAIMLVVVTLVSLLVQIYSTAYMGEDPGYSRYFAFMGLFTFSMLGLVVANNYLEMYVFWELVGLCSYLLIGFWYEKPSAAAAAKKAFVVTRFGDFGFLLAILLLFGHLGTFNFGEVAQGVADGRLPAAAVTAAALLVFFGAAGKSAQFPLHVWLPDAMEGPTPVSALIHAATMVAAGVYLVARTYGLFVSSAASLLVVAYIGGFTALFAATIAIAQSDIKRIVAYSTISQLGYMMMALGAGGFTAGVFHLMTHAFFKALLFLGAGSVILMYFHEQNIWRMGGLYRYMKITAITMIVAALANAGLFPFAGFFSKDEILVAVKESGHLGLYWIGAFTALLTAFYMFRLVFVVFFGPRSEFSPSGHEALPDIGNPRPAQVEAPGAGASGEPAVSAQARAEADKHLHESPAVVTLPLMILAFLSIVAGFWGWPGLSHGFGSFVFFSGAGAGGGAAAEAARAAHAAAGFDWPTVIVSNFFVLLGLLLAWVLYGRRRRAADPLAEILGPVFTVLEHKYYVDEFYLWFIRHFVDGGAAVLAWIDANIVNGIANGIGALLMGIGGLLRLFQNGWVQRYALIFFIAVLVLVAVLVYREPALTAAIVGGAR
ncbi:MAG: NADH-quinone oxidoreductase subunit L [Firmicutes bacterium]|nr:NADH-quinone oxidoreductase subunit L [Bacillota bacterium]